jgi:nicotinate-nucleotide adenylyltransferase
MKPQRIALFGGTFDPIHLGHTTVAQEVIQQLHLDKLIFIPAKRSPLKQKSPQVSDEDRLAMIRLSLQDLPVCEFNDYELLRPSPSYTLHTIRHFHSIFSTNTLLFWLIGADSMQELIHWYNITELLDECLIVSMYRAGCKTPDYSGLSSIFGQKRVRILQRHIVKTSLINISSTDIRRRLASGEDIQGLVHPDVATYIQTKQLYRKSPSSDNERS